MNDTKKYPSDQNEKVRQLRLEKKYTSSLILPCCDIHLIQLDCIHPVLSLAFVPQTQAASSQLRQLRRNVPCSFSCPMSTTWCIQNAGNATQCCDAIRAPLFGETNWSRCASCDCIHPVTQFCFSLTGGRHILTHTAPVDLLQESGSCCDR